MRPVTVSRFHGRGLTPYKYSITSALRLDDPSLLIDRPDACNYIQSQRKALMSKNEKNLAKLLNEQSSFTWPQLITLLRRLGYSQLEGSGSRVKFDNGDPSAMINLHKPHPGNELKMYVRRQIIEQLKTGGLIP